MDKIKEQLKILRFWLGSAMAIMVAILGWLITSNTKISALFTIVAIVFLLFVIVALSVIMHKKCETIGKIKKIRWCIYVRDFFSILCSVCNWLFSVSNAKKCQKYGGLKFYALCFLDNLYFSCVGKNCAPSVAIAISKLAILAISIPKKAKNPPKIPAKICTNSY